MDIRKAKSIVSDYLEKAKETESKIAEGRKTYREDVMKEHEARLREALAKERAVAESKLDALYQEAKREAQSWGKLDGTSLTADSNLLNGQGVNPDQFSDLVKRYESNPTMLDALRKYGERRNQETHSINYDVSIIPTVESKLEEIEAMRKRAGYFLDVSDGRGMDTFTLNFARAAADREFAAWGTDEDQAEKKSPGQVSGFADALSDAWGWKKKMIPNE